MKKNISDLREILFKQLERLDNDNLTQRYKVKNLAYSQKQRTMISDNYAKQLIADNKIKVSVPEKKIDIMKNRINKVLNRIK